MIPQTRYTKASDGTYLAYQAFGEGDQDLLWVPGAATHLEVFWEYPPAARFLRRLATFARVIWFDKRGTGLSDRVSRLPGLETMMDDVGVVLDTAGSERAILFGEGGDGGGVCALFAASFPQRSTALIWWDATPRSAWAPDYPWGMTEEQFAASEAFMEEAWGSNEGIAELVRQVGGASIADDTEAKQWWAKLYRYAATPAAAVALGRMWFETDVRNILPAIHVPSLVVSSHHREDFANTASSIPGAVLAEVPSPDRPPWRGDQDALFSVLGRFLDSVRDERTAFDRVLATVLFTDIVGSTDKVSSLGDRVWKELVEKHHALVRGLLIRFGGREVDTAGDGFFATFDGPARAIRCATAIAESVRRFGLEVRTGIHTGEVETIAGKTGGIAVVIGARIAGIAAPSEVLVSATVKDLVAGSGLAFEPRGEHELKGVPDHWRLYRVMREPSAGP
ncbi:MAG TPA: adenylate/guanylate cyclase domain-containing protein [Actinomycetota bacterium]